MQTPVYFLEVDGWMEVKAYTSEVEAKNEAFRREVVEPDSDVRVLEFAGTRAVYSRTTVNS